MSCFKVRKTAEGSLEVDLSGGGIMLALVFAAFSEKPLDAFLLSGREVGVVGNCGEPLITDATVIEKLSPRPRMRASGPWLFRALSGLPDKGAA